MNEKYTGIIVQESLLNKDLLNDLNVIKTEVSGNWHLFTVNITEEDIPSLSNNIESNKWYMHFWKGRDIIAVFKDKTFRFNYDDKDSWKPVVEYGFSIGIPKEQLDFPIE